MAPKLECAIIHLLRFFTISTDWLFSRTKKWPVAVQQSFTRYCRLTRITINILTIIKIPNSRVGAWWVQMEFDAFFQLNVSCSRHFPMDYRTPKHTHHCTKCPMHLLSELRMKLFACTNEVFALKRFFNCLIFSFLHCCLKNLLVLFIPILLFSVS